MSYSTLIAKAQVKAGDAAIKYCIEHDLASWYVVTRVKTGRGPSSKCLVSGPYTTVERASNECNYDSYFVEFLFNDEAKAITY